MHPLTLDIVYYSKAIYTCVQTDFSGLHFFCPLPEGHVGVSRGASVPSLMFHGRDQCTPLQEEGERTLYKLGLREKFVDKKQL